MERTIDPITVKARGRHQIPGRDVAERLPESATRTRAEGRHEVYR